LEVVMSETVVLKAKVRKELGKEFTGKARLQGVIPAEYYGPTKENVHLYCQAGDVARILRKSTGVNTLVSLEIEGDSTHLCLIREFQVHPVKRTLLHCDFYDVSGDRKVTVRVPLEFVGKAELEKTGGKREIILRDLRVRCRPEAIPSSIAVDVGTIQGSAIRISEVKFPEGIEPVYRVDQPVIMVRIPSEEATEAEAAPAEAAGEAKTEAKAESKAPEKAPEKGKDKGK
jgi:large subunit ribosomal protein L25